MSVLKIIMIIIMGVISFTRNIGKNFILSKLEFVLDGLDDPFWCRKIRCASTNPRTTNGTIKCRENIRFRVG